MEGHIEMASEDTNTKKDYEVGRGKPPKEHQYKPGQSGNRRGSSAKARARAGKKAGFDSLFSEGMQQPVEVEEDGRTVMLTRLHLAIRRRVEEAAKGKMAPLKELLKLRDMPDQPPPAPVVFGSQLSLAALVPCVAAPVDASRTPLPAGAGAVSGVARLATDDRP